MICGFVKAAKYVKGLEFRISTCCSERGFFDNVSVAFVFLSF